MTVPVEQTEQPAVETVEPAEAGATEEAPAVEQEQPAEEQPAGDETPTDPSDDLPDWAREKLTKANAEAANYRVRAREAEEKLKNAKSLEEVDEIVTQMRTERETVEHELLVENVALRHNLPEELAELLKGETREELEAHAKKLQKFTPDNDDEDVELEGGLSPRDRDPDAGLSPRELAAKYSTRKRR